MKFMGDHPPRGQTEQDVVCQFLKVRSFLTHVWNRMTICLQTYFVISVPRAKFRGLGDKVTDWALPTLTGEYGPLKDEAYCQLLKQITANTSSKPDSSQRGWRLLYILSAYYRCSEVLKPYLLKFLQDTSKGPGVLFQGIAKACEQNLRKTLQCGGRRVFPGNMELKAMVAGRSSKRQLILIPGGIERHLKIKTCTVALDVIEEVCYEMGLQKAETMQEYAIFVVTNKGQHVRPLNKKEYILDIATEAEQTDSSYSFWFRRVIWTQPLKFDNELCVTMHFNQAFPDYLKGLLSVLPQGKLGEQQCQQMCKLAALQHRAKDSIYLPTIRDVQDCVPAKFFGLRRPQQWLNMVTQHMQQVQALSPHQARAQFLGRSNIYFLSAVCLNALTAIAPARNLKRLKPDLGKKLFVYPFVGADGEIPPEGGAVHAHTEAYSWLQLPLRGGHTGRPDVPAHHAASAGAGSPGNTDTTPPSHFSPIIQLPWLIATHRLCSASNSFYLQ
uniref:Uncharacterized protein n=1 Tax=Paramormyrops kingsleyae TaxID=1676925 RepID=A0A3B3SW88_9TELE